MQQKIKISVYLSGNSLLIALHRRDMKTRNGLKRSNTSSTTHQEIETGGDNKAGGKTPAAEPAVAKWVVPNFFYLDDWRFLFVESVPLDTLMTMRLLCKDWRRVAT